MIERRVLPRRVHLACPESGCGRRAITLSVARYLAEHHVCCESCGARMVLVSEDVFSCDDVATFRVVERPATKHALTDRTIPDRQSRLTAVASVLI